ncbi:MAG: hypothetical protein ACT4PT_00595, partial [Methanobacteriota archaeon]
MPVVEEGSVRVRVPGDQKARGPGRRTKDPFFNPAMELTRDIGVVCAEAALAEIRRRPFRALDAMCGSGVRGLRYAVEAGLPEVTLNDRNRVAARLAAANARRNKAKVRVTCRDLGALLGPEVFSLVDLDPFGSPAPFLDVAVRGLTRRAHLAFTATDGPAVNGVFPRVARRHYGATTVRSSAGHEIALRVLVGAAVRAAARHEAGGTPMVAFARDHAYRVHLSVHTGSERADRALAALGHAYFCQSCPSRGFLGRDRADATCPECGKPALVAGPLWTGPLFDAEFLARMEKALSGKAFDVERAGGLVEAWGKERTAPAFYYDVHELAAAAGTSAPATDALFASLSDSGYKATRTYLSPTG